ncbi:MAG: PEP-CTERM sorting domain-containing protein, partial [Verrucomicrobiota bacterium]
GTFYTSRSAFEAALSSSTTITFEELPPTDWQGSGLPSVTASGVTFTGPWARLFITDPSGVLYPIPGSGKYLWQWDGGYPVSILLPAGVTAFGADFSGGIVPSSSLNATLTVNLAGGGSYAYNFSGPLDSWTFFGVTFAEPIANLVYRDAGPPDGVIGGPLHEEMLDNVTFGAIPEPSVLGLFALGGMFLGWRLRRWGK